MPKPGPRRPGTAVGLPQFIWDSRLRNYVDRQSGRMVKRAAIEEALGQVCDRGAATLAGIAQAAVQGTLTPRQFYEAMQREVRQLYNASAALGKGGWAQMTQSDWGTVGRQLREEYGRLRDFAQAIADGTITEGQALVRARLYADSAYKQYWRTWGAQQAALGNTEEHWWTVEDPAVCPVCWGLQELGWQPIGSLPEIGDPHPGDRCRKEYRHGASVQVGRQPTPDRFGVADFPIPQPKPRPAVTRANLTRIALESLAFAEEDHA